MCVLTLLAALQADAQSTDKPVFYKQNHTDNAIVWKLSDNGRWALVYGGSSEAQQNGRARVLDVLTQEEIYPQTEEDGQKNGRCTLGDVTDDGNIVAGSYKNQPAYWNKGTGTWTTLPVPAGCNGGYIEAVTPDGRYAVGSGLYTNEYMYTGVMWDLATNTIKEFANMPDVKVEEGEERQVQYTGVSADGRYVVIRTQFSYRTTNYLYDTQTDTYKTLGYKETGSGRLVAAIEGLYNIEDPAVSPNGKWVTGTARIVTSNDEYVGAMRYSVETDTYDMYNELDGRDMMASLIDNDGNVYAATPSTTPLREWSVRYGGFWYPFTDVLKQRYGVDFYNRTNYDNSGSLFAMSADGKTLAVMVSPQGESYIATLPEALPSSCAGINLLDNYSVTPVSGSSFAYLNVVEVVFDRSIQVLGGKDCVAIKDSKGGVARKSIGFAVSNSNSNTLVITFRPYELAAGETYTLEIPAGSVALAADENKTNNAFTISYTGRENVPVKPVTIYPADGSELAKIDNGSNPVMIEFDVPVKVSDNAAGQLINVSDGKVIAGMSVLASDRRIAIYPAATQYLYMGQQYKVVLDAGSVTDLSGSGANEEITIAYTGTYERQMGTGDALFSDDFSNISQSLNNFMRYDGDHNTPISSMAAMEFDAENQPWNMSIRDDDSYDYCAASHSMYSPAGQSDDWMMIPQLNIPDAFVTLTFDAQSFMKTKTDILKIVVWENDENINYLNKDVMDRVKAEGKVVFEQKLDNGGSQDMLEGEWTHYAVDLAEFAGKNIYIGFWNNNTDQSMIFVDNIEVKRSLKYIMSLSNAPSVVNKDDIAIAGSVTINSDTDEYNSIKLTLCDSDGKEIDTFAESGLSLKKGDSKAFAFTKPLPLTKGEINKFSIKVQLDDYTDVMNSTVKDLIFEPVKRVVLEEMTGTTCPNCPRGILAIENLEKTYGERFIPVSIHTYTGDPYGSGLTGYSNALGLLAAPSGMVNRNGIISNPMDQSKATGDYVFSNGKDLWMDYVASELNIPADIELTASKIEVNEENGTFVLPLTVRSAVNMKNQNLNVFAVALEDGIIDSQENNLGNVSDKLLGDWGKGGKYSNSINYGITHNDVARAYYGTSVNGTAGMLPQAFVAGEEYTTSLNSMIPENLNDVDNCKIVVMLIDGNTAENKVVNAVCVRFDGKDTGIGEAVRTAHGVSVNGGNIIVTGEGEMAVSLYTMSGLRIGSAGGSGTVTLSAGGYRGPVIVKVTDNAGVTAKKMILR